MYRDAHVYAQVCISTFFSLGQKSTAQLSQQSRLWQTDKGQIDTYFQDN